MIHKGRGPDSGFTLLEVLIAVTVLSLGILALAALQSKSVVQSQVSLQGSQAATLAYAYADLMRSNASQARIGGYQISANLATAPSPNTCTSTASTAPTAPQCSATQLAAVDAYNWYTLVTQTLPGGNARVSCADNTYSATCPVQMITVFWDQSRLGVTGLACQTNPTGYDPTANLACTQMGVQP
jgi:type IV pilus assembly protein PilV